MKTPFQKYLHEELDEEAEDRFLRTWFGQHFDHLLKKDYAEKLKTLGVYREATRSTTTRTRRHWYLAAALLLVFFAAWFIISQSGAGDPVERANKHLAEKPVAATLIRNLSSDRAADWKEAAEQFNKGNYAEAIQPFERLLEDQAVAEHHFFLGLCRMYKPNPAFDEAIRSFELATQLDEDAYAEEILWYGALAYLKHGQPAKAKESLARLVEKDRWKKKEATQLLKLIARSE